MRRILTTAGIVLLTFLGTIEMPVGGLFGALAAGQGPGMTESSRVLALSTGESTEVTLSAGPGVTAADLQAFNSTWMTPEARAGHIARATENFTAPFEPGAWITGEAMEAMVRMYDRTRDRAYLDHLRELSRVVLSYRDDRRTDRPGKVDPFRGKVMPAWGAQSVSSGYLHHTGVVIAGVYAYPIAAFARIVAEDPTLHADYGSDALAFATASLETLQGFSDELHGRPGDSMSSSYQHPRPFRALLTDAQCNRGYNAARRGFGPDGWAATDTGRLDGQKRNCNTRRQLAQYPLAHNENHAMVMAMIETWRAVDTTFHRQRVRRHALADWGRDFFPLFIKLTHRWFAKSAQSIPDARGRWIVWRHADGIPERYLRVEDATHAELSMRYVGVLHRGIESVNTALFRSGREPIDVSVLRRNLANTFLWKVGRGNDLAHKVNGEFSDKPRPYFNGTCNGWLDLTSMDVKVFDKCREITLRVVDGTQPNLSIGTHASLLANKP